MTPVTGVLPGKDPCLFLIRHILLQVVKSREALSQSIAY